METKAQNNYWKASNRRSNSYRNWLRDFYEVSEMFDGNENAWDALGRRERLAEVIYET